MKNFSDMHIAVLMGGPGSEREVSLASGKGVTAALTELGCRVTPVITDGEDFALPDDIDIVFNIIHGTFGEDGRLQEILEARGTPYTGEGVEGSRVAFDKILSKEKFRAAGVLTALSETLAPGARPSMPVPLVVKAPREGSSVGVYIVKDPAALDAALSEAGKLDSRILVEEFIQGRELTVGILGDQALPIIEIIPNEGFYDFKNKYPFLSPGGGAKHICPAPIDADTTARIQATALDARRALGLEVYCRVDFLLTHAGEAYALEINTIPGMTESSLLPEAAREVGVSYSELCGKIVHLSLARQTRNP